MINYVVLILAVLFFVLAKFSEKNINYLILVNNQNRLPYNWRSRVHLISVLDIFGNKCLVEEQTLNMFEKLQMALLDEGVDIELSSCFRSISEQKDIWNRFTEKYGIEYVKSHVAVPGFSEHHTGLAIDICIIKNDEIIDDNDKLVAEREIFETIHSKLSDFGFILRYMEGKENITGYAYEPWHIRYVGSEKIAKTIAENCWTLEEYLQQ